MYKKHLINTEIYMQAFNKYRNIHANRRLGNRRNFLIPTNASTLRRKLTVCSSIKLWHSSNLKDNFSCNPFKYSTRNIYHGKNDVIVTCKLDLDRKAEIILNKTKCDLIFRSIYSHTTSPVFLMHVVFGHKQPYTYSLNALYLKIHVPVMIY
jgi:hypothetical protein